MRRAWRSGLVCLSMLALAACGEGDPFGAGQSSGTGASTPTTGGTTTSPSVPGANSQAPTISGTPATTATVGNRYEFRPTASDSDSTTLTFSARGLPAWLTLVTSTGAISGTPTNDDAGETADITLTVSDGANVASLPVFRISVAPVLPPTPPPAANNQAPTISGTPATSVVATQNYSFTPSATDPDSGILNFSIANKPSWASFSITTGRLSGTPARTDAGTYSNIVISVGDGSLSARLPTFAIVVAPAPNVAPVISGTPSTSVQAGSTYSFMPSMWDEDGDPLTFQISGKPTWATFNSTNGSLTGTPTSAAVGTYPNIVISASDGKTSTPMPAFSITVTAPTNTAPTISGSPATSVQAGTNYSFAPSASDADGNALGYSIANKPSWASFSISSGQLSGTPSSSQVGTYSGIVISVNDGTTTASLPAFGITVTTAPVTNNPPTISGSPGTSVQAGSAYSFTPSASDPDGNTLTFSVSGLPSWASFNAGNGALTGTPDNSRVGTYSNIVITASDGVTSRSLPAFSVTVTSASSGNGTATLSWTVPMQNTDGSALTDLSGYKVYHGTSASSLTDVRTISSAGITMLVFDQLASGTHYFAVSAMNSTGTESARSAVGSKTIP